jgi:hypothetical protein
VTTDLDRLIDEEVRTLAQLVAVDGRSVVIAVVVTDRGKAATYCHNRSDPDPRVREALAMGLGEIAAERRAWAELPPRA